MTNEQVWDKVEELRAKHETLKADKIPLDLISFVELDLRLDLIPYDRLKDDFGADAAILADFSGFYIDGEIFDRIDIGDASLLEQFADYTVRRREKRDEIRAGRSVKRDYTNFRVVVDGIEHVRLPKNRAILTVVRGLHGFGVSPEVMRETINQSMGRFYVVEGLVADEAAFIELAARSAVKNEGRTFDPRRYFTSFDDLLPFEGKTFAFSNQWGPHTEKKMQALVAAHAGRYPWLRVWAPLVRERER